MKEQTTEIAALLLTWYAAHKRELPWRGARNPYYVWLSEVILQQTRVAQGLPYYQRFFDWLVGEFSLAAADLSVAEGGVPEGELQPVAMAIPNAKPATLTALQIGRAHV